MKPVTVIDEAKLDQICRCCLTTIDEVDVIIYNLSRLLNDLFLIEMRQDLPENICKPCSEEIFRICAFRKKVFESNEILNAVVLQNVVSSQEEDTVSDEVNYDNKEILNAIVPQNLVSSQQEGTVSNEINYNNTEILKIEISDQEIESHDDKNGEEVVLNYYLKIEDQHESLLSPSSNGTTELQHESSTRNDTIELSSTAKLKQKKCQKEAPKIYNCVCGETLHGYKTYVDHRRQIKHPRVARRLHPCTYCGKMFTTATMKYHIFKHTNARPYSCKTCGSAFNSPTNLRRHEYKHASERLACEICYKVLTYPQSLKDHLKLHSIKDSSVTRSSRKRPPVRSPQQCKICYKVFSSLQILRNHLLSHEEKSFLCSACGKTFHSKAALDIHYRSHSGEKPFSCNICKKKFTQQSSLKTHKLIHTGERPYVCEICAKSFTQHQHLRAHKVVHTEEKWFKCACCDKKYRQYTSLIVHRRSHTGETPYKCDQCGRGFRHSSAMKKHRTTHFKKKATPVDDSKVKE